MRTALTALLVLLAAATTFGQAPGTAPPTTPPSPAPQPALAAAPELLDWRTLEAPLLANHVQLTSRDMFVRAGEQYFSPDSRWMVFQAVPVAAAGTEPDPFYSMYVAKLRRDPASGRITGIETPIRISPPGSANTCGWFHPKEPWSVMFGSTLVRPADDQKGGFRVGTRTYKWLFPEEMDIVTRGVREIVNDYREHPSARFTVPVDALMRDDLDTAVPLFTRPRYDAECSYSASGRFVLYTRVREENLADRPDPDIYLYDTVTDTHRPLVVAEGYDGGPFFSPDGKMICYRSDRSRNDLLQIYVAQLAFDASGAPTGIVNEHALTDNGQVNWAPFWHTSGKLLVYGNSGADHSNYEVYAVEVSLTKPAKECRTRRVTFAAGADVLPAFSPDGKYMLWTSQRGPMVEGESKPSSQIWLAECVPGGFDRPETLFAPFSPSPGAASGGAPGDSK